MAAAFTAKAAFPRQKESAHVPQRVYRLLLSRLVRRIDSKDNPYPYGKYNGNPYNAYR